MGYCGYCRYYSPTISCEHNCRRTWTSVGFLWERECFKAREVPKQVTIIRSDPPVVVAQAEKPKRTRTKVQPDEKAKEKKAATAAGPEKERKTRRLRSWTEKEVAYLKEAYKTLPARVIAEHLGKTQGAIQRKINILGIKAPCGRGGRIKNINTNTHNN